jgi:UDPglucose--hexose-1-phosphate uridylyltransferase
VGDAIRRDPLTGAGVLVVADRQARPNLPAGCPFCPGGLEAPEPYATRWFPNRWPSLPDGRCEVHLFSADHEASLASLGADGVRRVVQLWADRTAALGARDDVAYVLLLENRGPEVGATITHPHGQGWGFAAVPEVPAAELAVDRCVLCEDAVDDDLVVVEHAGWRTWVPAAATSPYELRLAPLDHVPDLPSSSGPGRDAMAAVLADAFARLDRLFQAPMPTMLWIHQRPTDGGDWPTAHLHVHVHPLLRSPGTIRHVAAAELGSGVFVNPVDPRDAAAALRRT